MKSIQETQRYGERQHLKANTALSTQKKMNQKPYNQCLINLVNCTGRFLPSVFFAQKNLRYENLSKYMHSRMDLALG